MKRKVKKDNSELQRRVDGFKRRHRKSIVLVSVIGALCLIVLVWFGTATLSDPDFDWDVAMNTMPPTRKVVSVNMDTKVDALQETDENSETMHGSSGLVMIAKGGGKLITDTTKNPYMVPLYDGLTFDVEAMGIESWIIPYVENPFDVIRNQIASRKYIITQENRRCEGGSASWNWYDEINYSPSSKCGDNLPYTEVDGRISVAVPWRWSVPPSTYPLDKAATVNMAGDASQAGQYYDVVFTDGTVLAVIGGSAKGTEGESNTKFQGYMHYDTSFMEIVQYTDLPVGKPWKAGYDFAHEFCAAHGIPDNGYGPGWTGILRGDKDVAYVVAYKIQHYTTSQGYKNWFTGD